MHANGKAVRSSPLRATFKVTGPMFAASAPSRLTTPKEADLQAKTKLLRASVVLALVSAAVFATAPSASAAPTTGPAMVRHYGDGSGTTVASAGQAQCVMPTSARQGAWVCGTAVAQPLA